MKVIAILGPLGSGKTTIINNLLRSKRKKELGKILVVVNDVGTANVDAKRLSGLAEIRGLTSGCIGCSDLPQFIKVMRAAQESDVNTLIIEPTGVADGREIRDAVQQITDEWKCLALVDVQHHDRNLAFGILPTQLAVATHVGVTWWWEQFGDAFKNRKEHVRGIACMLHGDIDTTMETIGTHASRNTPIYFIKPDGEVPAEFWAAAPHIRSHDYSCTEARPHSHNRARSHGHVSHDHGFYAVSVDLRKSLTFAELTEAIISIGHLPRAKGVVEGREFDMVADSLKLGDPSTNAPHGNFISHSPLPPEFLNQIASAEGQKKLGTKKDLLRMSFGTAENTVAAIRWMADQYPQRMEAPDGTLRVDCEADVIEQLARREFVPAEWRKFARKTYVRWRLKAFASIMRGAWGVNPDCTQQDKWAYCARRLGITLTYAAVKYGEDLDDGERLHAKIKALPTAKLALEGLLALKKPSGTPDESLKVIETVIEFGRKYQNLDEALVMRVKQHLARISSS